MFDASYLVLGLGDVYLGAPVATPLDPRHRLVTTKYNPARTWTPENVVGIGGAYMCVYGMEGPGGYQFVGRTCRCGITIARPPISRTASPGCCASSTRSASTRSATSELLELRAGFHYRALQAEGGRSDFRFKRYNAFLQANAASISAFKSRQQAAFEAERERWKASGQAEYVNETTLEEADTQSELAAIAAISNACANVKRNTARSAPREPTFPSRPA